MIIYLCQLCGNIYYRAVLYSSEGDCPNEECEGKREDLIGTVIRDDEDFPEVEFVGGLYEFKREEK